MTRIVYQCMSLVTGPCHVPSCRVPGSYFIRLPRRAGPPSSGVSPEKKLWPHNVNPYFPETSTNHRSTTNMRWNIRPSVRRIFTVWYCDYWDIRSISHFDTASTWLYKVFWRFPAILKCFGRGHTVSTASLRVYELLVLLQYTGSMPSTHYAVKRPMVFSIRARDLDMCCAVAPAQFLAKSRKAQHAPNACCDSPPHVLYVVRVFFTWHRYFHPWYPAHPVSGLILIQEKGTRSVMTATTT